MVEFNLLPDVKMEYLRTKRLEHLVVTTSFIVGAATLAIFVLLFLFVDVAQKLTLNDLTNQINNSSAQLTSNSNLNKVLTVQNQLETLPKLEDQAPKTSRLFGFITQLTPVNTTISTLNLNLTTHAMVITGGADSLATVNTYVDTIKHATYNDTVSKTKNAQAFTNVVLSSFSYSSTGTPPAQYTINCSFSPTLFKSSANVTLVVPSETATLSILNQPTLFKANTP
jgi:hypothetical protein